MNKKPPPGKAAEPSADELEFIYSRLDKRSDSEILDEMQEEDFPLLRTKGFINRRRKEFAIAKRVLHAQLEKEIDPIKAKMREEHFRNMADIAKAVLATDVCCLDSVRENIDRDDSKGEYLEWPGDDAPWFDRKELSARLKRNVDIAAGRDTEHLEAEYFADPEGIAKSDPQYDFECLVAHLKRECPIVGRKGLDKAVQQDPYTIIEALRVISRRKTLKGKCVICAKL